MNNIYIEPRLKPKPLYETKTNWIQEFCENTRKDRIIWRSKLHANARKFANKSMYEQVEELIDIVSFFFFLETPIQNIDILTSILIIMFDILLIKVGGRFCRIH